MTKRKLLKLLATMQANYRNVAVEKDNVKLQHYYKGWADCCNCICSLLVNKKYCKWYSELQDSDYIKNEQRYKQKC